MDKSLRDKIFTDYQKSLLSKEKEKVGILRFLLNLIHNKELEKKASLRKKGLGEKEIEKESPLSNEEVFELISKEIKKTEQAIELFKRAKRIDLVEKENLTIKILREYLPKQLTDEELEKIIKETLKEIGVSEKKDFGRAMKAILNKVKNRAQPKKVSEILKGIL